MAENQQNVDALLAEVSALADEAVADVAGEESSGETKAGPDDGQATAGPPETGQTRPEAATDECPIPAATGSQPTARPPDTRSPPTPPGAPAHPDAQRILCLEVPVIVRLAERTMPLSEIVGLSTGAIIEFDKPADSQLDLMINNKCVGQGQAVKVGENFGLRVTNVGSVRDRIKAMGNQ
jgi:flagellar motor switch protein FliN/FliY